MATVPVVLFLKYRGKDMETFKINTTVSLKKSEKRKMLALQEEYGFCISAIVLNVAYRMADGLIKNKQMCKRISCSNMIGKCALELYKPFCARNNNLEHYALNYSCKFSYDKLKDRLKEAGILEPNIFFASIIRAIIKYPNDASRIKILGVHTKRCNSILRAKKINNRTINSTINLPEESYNLLKEIAQRNGSSVRGMVIEVVKSICDIYFNNNSFTENSKTFKKVILYPPRVIEGNMHCKYGRFPFSTSDVRLSVQMKAVMEKYGIPSIRDFIKRIAYFIILVDNGDVKLTTVRIIDNTDYNEERMIRNAFKNEVTYGTY